MGSFGIQMGTIEYTNRYRKYTNGLFWYTNGYNKSPETLGITAFLCTRKHNKHCNKHCNKQHKKEKPYFKAVDNSTANVLLLYFFLS